MSESAPSRFLSLSQALEMARTTPVVTLSMEVSLMTDPNRHLLNMVLHQGRGAGRSAVWSFEGPASRGWSRMMSVGTALAPVLPLAALPGKILPRLKNRLVCLSEGKKIASLDHAMMLAGREDWSAHIAGLTSSDGLFVTLFGGRDPQFRQLERLGLSSGLPPMAPKLAREGESAFRILGTLAGQDLARVPVVLPDELPPVWSALKDDRFEAAALFLRQGAGVTDRVWVQDGRTRVERDVWHLFLASPDWTFQLVQRDEDDESLGEVLDLIWQQAPPSSVDHVLGVLQKVRPSRDPRYSRMAALIEKRALSGMVSEATGDGQGRRGRGRL